MKYNGNIDLRGDIGVQSGSKATINPGGELKVDGTANFNSNDTRFNARVDFNDTARHDGRTEFYGGAGFDSQISNKEVALDPEIDDGGAFNKDVNWDWSEGNSFHLKLSRGVTVHTPLNVASSSMQANLVVQQPDSGFYRILWSSAFKFVDGTQVNPTQSSSAVDLFSFHISPTLGTDKVLVAAVQNLFYST